MKTKKVALSLLLLVIVQTVIAQVPTTGVSSVSEIISDFWHFTGFYNIAWENLVMIIVGIICITLGISKGWEPLLLIPIGFGMIIGNIPFQLGHEIGYKEEGSVLNTLYDGIKNGWYPPLIFLGIGAMTDFSSLISNPKLMLLGAAAQIGIFTTFIGAVGLGFSPQEAGAIGIIGGADGPTAIFLTSKLAPDLLGAIAVAAYSYMALVPVIQPPIMRLLTTHKERQIRMKQPRAVTKREKIIFPIAGLILTTLITPSALPLLGMLFFGNLLKESTVTERLADVSRNALVNVMTLLVGLMVGVSTQASTFLTLNSVKIVFLGMCAFAIATACGVLFAKIMNLFLKEESKINPLIGCAGVSAVPHSARVAQVEGLKADPGNHLLMHAMAPNVAGVIGSAIAAGVLLSMLS
jgi:oxaloacetate decarboxylase beta subunit